MGVASATRKIWLVTDRSLPSEGLLMVAEVRSSGAVTVKVVEPPPSRHRAVTQPSSTIRWATWVSVAPME